MGEPLFFSAQLGLWVGKGDPDFADFLGPEAGFDKIYACAQEADVVQVVFKGIGGSFPDAVAFDVNADEVFVGMQLRQAY